SFASFLECRESAIGRKAVEQSENRQRRLPLLGERAGVREDVSHKSVFVVIRERPATVFQRAQAFLQAFLERAADGHRFADAFHLRGERGVGLRNGGRAPAPRRRSAESW